MFGDTATEFNFCLYDKLHSTQNCTDGLFSSLPLEIQEVLWSRIFHNGTEIDYEKSNIREKKDLVLILFLTTIIVIIGIIIATGVMKCRSLQRSLAKKTKISIPKEDDDDCNIEMQHLKNENVSKKGNERGLLLEYETETKSCHSDFASTGYGSESSIPVIINDCLKSLNVKELKTTLFGETFAFGDFDQDVKTSDTHNANSVKEKRVISTDVIKTSLTALLSPEKKCSHEKNSNENVCLSEDKNSSLVRVSKGVQSSVSEENSSTLASVSESATSTICNASEPVITTVAEVSEGTQLDTKKLDWTTIFSFLTEQIDPKMNILFFTLLLDRAGAKNAYNIIESVKIDTNCIKETTFSLFNRWKHGAGSAAKPKDIEEVFGTLNMNLQLYKFKEFMRNPPYLPDDRIWNEHDIPSNSPETRQILPQQHFIVQVQVNSRDGEQAQTRGISFTSSETIEENISVNNLNEVNVRRRKCDNDSGESAKYRRLEDSLIQNTGKRIVRRRRRCKRKKYKLLSKSSIEVNGKMPVSLPGNTSIDAPCPSKDLTSKVISETNISTSSSVELYSSAPYIIGDAFSLGELYSSAPYIRGDYVLSSGYGSMSSNMNSAKQTLSSNNFNGNDLSNNLHLDVPSNSSINSERGRQKQKSDYKRPLKQIKKNKQPKNKRVPKMSKQKNIKISSASTECVIEYFLESIINDLVERMAPSKEDLLSLTFEAYSNAECLITSWKEKIFVISSKKQSLPIRESEWNTIRMYVGNVRDKCMDKSQEAPRHENTSLFLNPNVKTFTR